MRTLRLLVAVILVGILAALTYHVFENAVHWSIDAIWYDMFNTDENRILVIPLALVFTLTFFGLQHWLDPRSENKEEHGLGDIPAPDIPNYLKVLLIGFFSLLAGATLGPEAILVPACMIAGSYVGVKLYKNDKELRGLLGAAGLMALFAAFFDSSLVGILSLFLVLAQSKTRFKPILLTVAIAASVSAKVTLNFVEGSAYADIPNYGWHINPATIIAGAILLIAGFFAVQIMDYIHTVFKGIKKTIKNKDWLVKGVVAALVLSLLFTIGGPLVEFTGNRSIIPMFEQAQQLGLVGLLWILFIKIVAISWSKAIGYRGGMIFPTIFLAAVMVAIIQLYISDVNPIHGMIAFLVGALIANKNNRILV